MTINGILKHDHHGNATIGHVGVDRIRVAASPKKRGHKDDATFKEPFGGRNVNY